ncbi:PREDICTED: coagulation factor X isoform 1-like [Polistes canadensis]|uniref:coagulation factor X isoform 1-like n=1 Tax=Polistes canadensis TaxID=91411 RepID=UPI000718E354|nr:PREDICTED: coagulation factor X isoform 1-like [Polistes canadensis]
MGIADRKCLFFIAFGSFLTFLQPSNGADKANSCLVPPRLDNGIWAIYLEEGFNFKKQVEEGEELPLKSQLYCECNFGYQVAIFEFARCTSNGSWDYIPVCKRIMRPSGNVKHIYVHCNYLGSSGNYASDIALLEIEVPFVFTNMLTPACLDGTIIESGEGIVAGFGFTASGSTSPLLQLTTLPYVSDIQCKDINNSVIYEQYITNDKFCAGYTNGTSVCDGDSGGGILLKTRELWFLRGIVSSGISVNLGGGTSICDSHSYSLYIRISSYFSWIQNIIYKINQIEFPCIKKQALTK